MRSSVLSVGRVTRAGVSRSQGPTGFTSLQTRANSGESQLPRAGTVPEHRVHLSCSTDPYFNLAYEDWLFRKTDPEKEALLIYRNAPCVVIGRNQNPWKEINLQKLRELQIPFVRRMSGGGSVYHDLGNTNYCIMVPREEFERKKNAQLVADALQSLGVNAYVNDRHDICLDTYKISGSAFKIISKRAYHHGTMLMNSRLSELHGLLGGNPDIETKGVLSVPSPVVNVAEYAGVSIDHDSFSKAVVTRFGERYGGAEAAPAYVDPVSVLNTNEHVKNMYTTLKTWEWAYGQTPEFTHRISLPQGLIEIVSKHGLITDVRLDTPGSELIRSFFVNRHYGFVDMNSIPSEWDSQIHAIAASLIAQM